MSVKFVSATSTLSSTDKAIRVNMASPGQTLTLAPAALCEDMQISVLNLGSNSFTLAQPAGQESVVNIDVSDGNLTMAQNQGATLFCDGVSWFLNQEKFVIGEGALAGTYTTAASAAVDVGSTTATNAAIVWSRRVQFTARAADTSSVLNTTPIISAHSYEPTLQTDVDRTVQVKVTNNSGAGISGSVYVYGINQHQSPYDDDPAHLDPEALAFTVAAGQSQTLETTVAYATVTSIVTGTITGALGLDTTIEAGYGNAYGVIVTPGSNLALSRFSVNGVNYSGAQLTRDQTNFTVKVVGLTPPDNADISALYTVSVTPTQNAHVHAQATHSHTVTIE